MGDGGDSTQLVPRLCHIVRWPDFNGYGFNLHAEKGKAGQFIGKVDEGSPAEAAGLKQGDRIVEVNGTNIGNENHQQVVARIKAGGDETRLLVVDAETDQYYKDEKKVVRGDLPEVRHLTAARDRPIESQDAEPVATIGSVSYNSYDNNDATNGDESSRYPPRLCQLCKWADFDGYGFNLHAEKDKPGQYIGSVDPDSPAETGGLKENDRIIEVNGENIESQTHSVVIQKIKSGGDRTTLLVVDREADQYYKSRGQTVSSHMASVLVCTTPAREASAITSSHQSAEEPASEATGEAESDNSQPPSYDALHEAQKTAVGEEGERGEAEQTHVEETTLPEPNLSLSDEEPETVTAVVSETVETAPEPEQDNLQNGTEEAEEAFPPPVTDDVTEAVAVMTVGDDDDVDDVVDASTEEVGGGGVEVNAYEEVEVTRTTSQSYDADFGTTSNGINGGPESSVPEPTPVAAPEPEPLREPEPAVIRSTTTTVESSGSAPTDGDPILQLSAAEMKERLKSRKRQDPRLQKTSFEAKHKMFERM